MNHNNGSVLLRCEVAGCWNVRKAKYAEALRSYGTRAIFVTCDKVDFAQVESSRACAVQYVIALMFIEYGHAFQYLLCISVVDCTEMKELGGLSLCDAQHVACKFVHLADGESARLQRTQF